MYSPYPHLPTFTPSRTCSHLSTHCHTLPLSPHPSFFTYIYFYFPYPYIPSLNNHPCLHVRYSHTYTYTRVLTPYTFPLPTLTLSPLHSHAFSPSQPPPCLHIYSLTSNPHSHFHPDTHTAPGLSGHLLIEKSRKGLNIFEQTSVRTQERPEWDGYK